MKAIEVTREISAPVEKVFDVVSDIQNFSQAIDDILKVEFLSEQKSGLGAKFRETRRMGSKEASTVLTVTEYEKNHKIRLIADEGGTIWDTVFTTEMIDEKSTKLHMVMEAKPYRIMPRLMNFFIRGFVCKAVESDMDAVKSYCEK